MQAGEKTPSGRGFLWAGLLAGAVLLAALLSHGFGLFGGSGKSNAEPPMVVHEGSRIVIPEHSPLRSRLAVQPAVQEAVSDKVVLPGIVESNPALTAAVLSPFGGRVVKLGALLGDRVRRGQVLAVIDSPDLAQARDDDVKAADTFALARKNLARQQEQLKLGTISVRDLDQARSDEAQANAEYKRTQARLSALGISTATGQPAGLFVLRSPVDGSVTALNVARGNLINDPTQPVMTVADLSTVWVTAMVPEKDLPLVAQGQDAEVTLPAYPNRVLEGKVLFVSDVLEPDTRRDKLRIAFANPLTELKPNMFATVVVRRPARSRVVVPTSALLMNNDRTSVFVAVAPWTFERRNVDPHLEEGTSVTIESGVRAGEPVVVKGGILLND